MMVESDLITSSTMNDVIKIFLNNGGNGFISLEDAAAEKGPEYIVPGDFTGDNIPDLAVANRRDASISILQGRGRWNLYFPSLQLSCGSQRKSHGRGGF